MRPTPAWLLPLLLGACSNLIPGFDEAGVIDSSQSGDTLSAETALPEDELGMNAPPDGVTTEAWRVKRGQVLRTFAFRALERGLVEEARGYLQEACELDPRDVESHCALARLFLAEGDPRAALAYAERIATSTPDNPGVRLVYAATLAETGQDEEAGRQVELAWERSGHDPALARAMVTHYEAEEPGGAAQEFVQQVLAEHPKDPRSWTAAGDLFLAQGQTEEAATAYAQAIALDPKVPAPSVLESYLGRELKDLDPILAAAVQAERDGDLAGAERLYRYLAVAKSALPEVQSGLARVLWRRGRLDAAGAALEQIPLAKRGWREHLLDAKIRFQRSDWEGARGSLLLTLELRPELRAAELLLGHVERVLAGLPPVADEPAVEAAEAAPEAPAAEPAQDEPAQEPGLDGGV